MSKINRRHCEEAEGRRGNPQVRRLLRSLRSLAMTLPFFFFSLISSGCIHLTGGAGYWHKGPGEESPKSKQVKFDSNDYVPGASAPGSISTGSQ